MVPERKVVEETLIREVLGWPIVEDAGAVARPDELPAVFWSSSDRCFRVARHRSARPERFSPIRSFRDAWEVGERLRERGFRTGLARPAFDGYVRVVARRGEREVVSEARSISCALAFAVYEAARAGLLESRPPS